MGAKICRKDRGRNYKRCGVDAATMPQKHRDGFQNEFPGKKKGGQGTIVP
jgi:hypothetical protein